MAAEGEAATERAFNAYGKRVKSVKEFHYLGRILTSTDDDWPAEARNLRKARETWRGAGDDIGTGGGGPEGDTQFLYLRDTAGPPLRGGDMGAATYRPSRGVAVSLSAA